MRSDFQAFLKENHKVIAKVCSIYTDNPDDFDDYYQECILQLWKSFKTFRGTAKISTWVYKVCLNVCLSQLRTKKKRVATTHDFPKDFKDETENTVEEQLEVLYKAIRLLKESDRAIIILYLDDKSYKEMAEILGISVTNVGAKVNRVKNQLKVIINERS